jgi:large subunit ribosomal protein L21
MIAIIELKGKQYRVEPDQVIRSLRVSGDVGAKVQADRVLATIDGDKVDIGRPALESAEVELEIVRQTKSPKLHVFTYNPRKRTSRRIGYREDISYLRVKSVKG